MSTTKKEIENYFNIQKEYYVYLKNQMPDMFKGESKEANGMIKIDGWEHLSNIEDSHKFRRIALECMDGMVLRLIIRNGESIMEAICHHYTFPEIVITKYLNARKYGRKLLGGRRYIWKTNEIKDYQYIKDFDNGNLIIF